MADPSYETAPSISQGKRDDPVQQCGLWNALSSVFVESFAVRQPIEEPAERFRIQLETSFDDLDRVKAACFQVRRHAYAIVSHRGSPVQTTLVWLFREDQHEESASVFLEAFGLAAFVPHLCVSPPKSTRCSTRSAPRWAFRTAGSSGWTARNCWYFSDLQSVLACLGLTGSFCGRPWETAALLPRLGDVESSSVEFFRTANGPVSLMPVKRLLPTPARALPTRRIRSAIAALEVFMAFHVEQDIDAEPADVWVVLTDVERWPEWTRSMAAVRRLEDGPFGLGSTVQVRQPRLPQAVYTVTAYEQGEAFTWTARTPGLAIVADHRIRPRGDGLSSVELAVEMTGPLAPVAGLLLGSLIRRYIALEAEGLKRRCELHP